MKLSWKWLQEIVFLPVDVFTLAEKLTAAGTEVESIEGVAPNLVGAVIASVREITPHSGASHLKVAEVEWGKGSARCITAATNVKKGDKVPYGPPGAVLADGTVLGVRDFDGASSEGMMLSAEEIGLPSIQEEEGILILPPDAPIGEDVRSWLGLDDVVMELSITPNRGDLLSVLGVARECCAIIPEARLRELKIQRLGDEGEWPLPFEGIKLLHDGCLLYLLGLATDVNIAPSPMNVKVKLALSGMRPINNIVDATNLAMLLLGQPLHAFDYDRLPSPEITVRTAKDGERFMTLDGKERILTPSDLLITSGGAAVGIAGVMGGANTEVTEGTQRIVVESAIFDPIMISATSRRLGIASEAAYRFARGVDLAGARPALEYVLQLLREWGAAVPHPIVKSEARSSRGSRIVSLRGTSLKKYLLSGDMDEASKILARLGFEEVVREKDRTAFLVPTYRLDVSIEEDLIEEVARIKGYDSIPSRLPPFLRKPGEKGTEVKVQARLREIGMARGYTEVVTYSFISPDFVPLLRFKPDDPRSSAVSLLNPLSKDQATLRTSLLPGLLKAACDNVRNGWRAPIRIFEMGRVFCAEENGVLEEDHIGGVVFTGKEARILYPELLDDLLSVKADVEAFAAASGLKLSFVPGEETFAHKGQSAHILCEGKRIGYLARIKPSIERELELGASVYAFEFDLSPLTREFFPRYALGDRFPPVMRDVAIIVPKGKSADSVLGDIKRLASPLVCSIRLFDVYEGQGIPEGQRSLAFSLEYKSPERTLSDEEVEEHHRNLRAALSREGYIVR